VQIVDEVAPGNETSDQVRSTADLQNARSGQRFSLGTRGQAARVMTTPAERIGAVVIGRNEGARLQRCLTALNRHTDRIVYVDSGSTDGSADLARSFGIDVLELEMSVPFTAARARNAGFARLRQRWPTAEYVQFIDGDMEVLDGWLATAAALLDKQPQVVAVWGRRCERNPERSIYNRICNIEWCINAGSSSATFGGDVMIRISALAEVGGYAPHVIAAEDDELGLRLRAAGGILLSVDQESTLHDADMYRFKQWWVRANRCGYAYAQVSSLSYSLPERKFARELRRAFLLGAILPAGALALAIVRPILFFLTIGLYPVNAGRIALATRRRGFSWADSAAWGASCALAPIPQILGAAKYYLDLLLGKRPEIIEHKTPLKLTPPQSKGIDGDREQS